MGVFEGFTLLSNYDVKVNLKSIITLCDNRRGSILWIKIRQTELKLFSFRSLGY